MHCAPTQQAAMNLKRENIPSGLIFVSGNTVIDALLQTAAENPEPPSSFPHFPKTILMTAHRRESFGARLREAFRGVRAFVDLFPDVAVYFPVHPHPEARAAAEDILADHERVFLVSPLSYRELVGAMNRSWLVLTDSGGLQEEAPALGKPVLVLRDVTERPEAVETGVVQLVGTARQMVFESLCRLHRDKSAYDQMARPVFPYGDGQAAKRIISSLPQFISGLGRGRGRL
jgi:UDP-N-acetylglucosamine 2-epimerase (non-hydrolysing)